ncbi:MAG: hypothetical protein ABIH01_03925 [Candidatus Omnitrophota bacterium]
MMQKKMPIGVTLFGLLISFLLLFNSPLLCKAESFQEIDNQVERDRKQLNFSFKTNKKTYMKGEPIYVIGTWTNSTNRDISIEYPFDTFKFDKMAICDMSRPDEICEFEYPNESGVFAPEPEKEILKPGETRQDKVILDTSDISRKGLYYIQASIPSKNEYQHAVYIEVK